MKTFLLATSFGAKRKGGADLRPEDLWKLKTDPKPVAREFVVGSPEHRQWYQNIKDKYKLK